MPVAGGGFEQCYNAQAIVAAGSLLVITADVVQAPNDKHEIEALQTSLRQSRHATTTDSLTGLFSRGFLQAHLSTHLEETADDRPLSLAYMRLDTLA